MKFEVGDNVLCVDCGENRKITTGNIYIVLQTSSDGNEIRINHDDGNGAWYYSNRFKLSTSVTNSELFKSIELAQSFIGKRFTHGTTKSVGSRVKVYLSKEEFDGYGSLSANIEFTKRGYAVCVHGENDYEYPVHDIELVPSSITMKLTQDYDAIIYANKVEVGCQTISKSVLSELLLQMEKL